MTKRSYLDWNATAMLRPEARDATMAALDLTGNPSSVHYAGRAARALVEKAREQVASLVGVTPHQVVFTSGGTEANALALTPALAETLLVSAIEHPSVLSGGRFSPDRVCVIPATPAGTIDLSALEQLLERASRPLVSVMLANNETGAIQPLAQIANSVHGAGGLLHCDAVQGPGRIDCDFKALGVDLMTLSGHKIGAPQGVGASIRRDGLEIEPLWRGGGQEQGARAGTENVAAIAGFGAAAEATASNWRADAQHLLTLRRQLEVAVRAVLPNVCIFAETVDRLPNTVLFAVPGIKAETAVIAFDLEGVAVSSGAACSSGKVAPSHVLAAMGVPGELASGAVRLSLGFGSTAADIELFRTAWAKLGERLYKPNKANAHEIAA